MLTVCYLWGDWIEHAEIIVILDSFFFFFLIYELTKTDLIYFDDLPGIGILGLFSFPRSQDQEGVLSF